MQVINSTNLPQEHSIIDLILLFNQTVGSLFNTRLVKGKNEPIYLPANNKIPYNQIIFAHGFYTSALHEIAHWCLAGEQRRLLEDYGYWYCPDGRNEAQQLQFERVEIKPQAIEWCLSVAAGINFKVSCDNLNGSFEPDRHAFRAKVFEQVKLYLETGLPNKAALFTKHLAQFYKTPYPLNLVQFNPFEK